MIRGLLRRLLRRGRPPSRVASPHLEESVTDERQTFKVALVSGIDFQVVGVEGRCLCEAEDALKGSLSSLRVKGDCCMGDEGCDVDRGFMQPSPKQWSEMVRGGDLPAILGNSRVVREVLQDGEEPILTVSVSQFARSDVSFCSRAMGDDDE